MVYEKSRESDQNPDSRARPAIPGAPPELRFLGSAASSYRSNLALPGAQPVQAEDYS